MSTITIAIAGGAGNIGRTLLEAVENSAKYRAIVLSRKEVEIPGSNSPVLVVDYNNVDALKATLESHQVQTVISALMLMAPDAGVAEQNLVKAAALSNPTKRFVASDWGIPVPKSFSRQPPQQPHRDAVVAELRKTKLEWTRVYNGLLLDYFGLPHIESFMPPFTTAVDIPYKSAAIPGTGNDPVTFTYSKDVASLVIAALDLEKWEEETFCIGEKMSWNEFVGLAEELTGSKFKISYDSVEQLEKNEVTLLPSKNVSYETFTVEIVKTVLSVAGLYAIAGFFNLPEEKSLDKLFPEIKVMKVKDVLSVWQGKL